MKIQPALPTQRTGKVKLDLQTHLRVSTVCLQDTHPKKSSPLSQEIAELSTAPISAGLKEFLNIARAKPHFRFFYSLFSSLVSIAPDLLREYLEYFTEIHKDSLFLPLRRQARKLRGRRCICCFSPQGTSPWIYSSIKQAAAFRRTRRKGKATALTPQAGADSLRDVIFSTFLLHLIPTPGWFFPYLSHHWGHFPKHLLGCGQQLWEQHKGRRGQKQGGLTLKTFFFPPHKSLMSKAFLPTVHPSTKHQNWFSPA